MGKIPLSEEIKKKLGLSSDEELTMLRDIQNKSMDDFRTSLLRSLDLFRTVAGERGAITVTMSLITAMIEDLADIQARAISVGSEGDESMSAEEVLLLVRQIMMMKENMRADPEWRPPSLEILISQSKADSRRLKK